MVKSNKVLIEKFKGFDIYYDKEKEKFVVDKDKLNIHFETKIIWDMKGIIRELDIVEIDKHFFIKSGYFGKSVSKIHLLTQNNTIEQCKYKIEGDTCVSYEVGKMVKSNIPKLYPKSQHNHNIYNELLKLENEIKSIESKQRLFVNNLR